VVERALGYPFSVPPRSFVLVGERTLELGALEVDSSRRIALLAYGSNASPQVLARKLGSAAIDAVPVVRAQLSGFDVVYSAHISAYGSVPATLRPSPGTEAPVYVAYLTPEQLGLISSTEPNYELERLRGLLCRLETGEALSEASAYLSRHGCLLVDGSEVALDSVAARGRAFPAMSQRQVLEQVRDLLRPGQDLERFILDCVSGAVPRDGF